MRDFNIPGRSAAMAANGMAATSHPMATLAALDVLRAGGNAADAAIAAVAMQCVVEPQSTGIGGDCFILYSRGGALPVALNGSGRAPAKATVEWYVEHGIREIAVQTPHAVTMPGAVDAWCVFNREYGSRPLAELLEPAARAAEDGYVVTPRVASDWHRNQAKLRDPVTAALFLPGGKPPDAGDRMANPPLAATLRRIGREGREAFYSGAVMRDILGALKALGGLHEEEDFAAQRSNWVEPITAPYRGYEVYECPPNGQGMAALMILRHLGRLCARRRFVWRGRPAAPPRRGPKAAYRVRDKFICDPAHVAVDVAGFLSEPWAERSRRAIRLDQALPGQRWAEHRAHGHGLSVRRRSRRQCVLVYQFAVLVVRQRHRRAGKRRIAAKPRQRVPHDPRPPQCDRAGQAAVSHDHPGMLVKDGRAVMPFGVMGGQYQAVGHAHFVHRMH